MPRKLSFQGIMLLILVLLPLCVLAAPAKQSRAAAQPQAAQATQPAPAPAVPAAPVQAAPAQRQIQPEAAFALMAALSLVITARIVRPLRGLFVSHTAQTNASLVGQTCKVLTGVVDERQGRAEVAQRGASINIRVWSPSPNLLKRGDTALITDYDSGSHRYLVMPLPPA